MTPMTDQVREPCREYCGLDACTCAAGATLRRLDDDIRWANRVLQDSQEHRQIVRLQERLERFHAKRKQLIANFPSPPEGE
jgi:predicted Fe-S protein YdhL (DUF1289 family)